MNEAPDSTRVLDKSSSSITLNQLILQEILRQGPSYIMVGLATGIDYREVKEIIDTSPELKSAYRMALAKVGLLIRETCGNRTMIAEAMNVQRHIVEQWIRENRALQVEDDNASESIVDFAEAALVRATRADKDWAVLHVLNTKGKKRGWAKRDEIDLHAYAQATNTDVRSIVGDVVAAIAAGKIANEEAIEL